MKYHHQHGVTKDKKRPKILWVIILLLMLAAGVYILVSALSPNLTNLPISGGEATSERLLKKQPGDLGDRLFIPQINIDVAIAAGDKSVLEKGAWHRVPENGNPVEGGNFVLSAHRFELGMTPQQTRAKSPFYNIDKLQVGDQIFVDYKGKRYAYKIDKKYKVDRSAVEIEAKSSESKMTLYSCDLRGEKAGREVIEAKPVGVVANGTIELNSSLVN